MQWKDRKIQFSLQRMLNKIIERTFEWEATFSWFIIYPVFQELLSAAPVPKRGPVTLSPSKPIPCAPFSESSLQSDTFVCFARTSTSHVAPKVNQLANGNSTVIRGDSLTYFPDQWLHTLCSTAVLCSLMWSCNIYSHHHPGGNHSHWDLSYWKKCTKK